MRQQIVGYTQTNIIAALPMETKASNATVTVVDIFANKIFPMMMPMLLQRQTCGEKQKCTANPSYKTFYNHNFRN